MTELLERALSYAARDWAVFPVHGVVRGQCTCGRQDCSSPGKHPLTRHGLKDASTESELITEWWSRWPAANIGIATGESGIVVIDIDLPLALASLDVVLHKLPRTLTGLTGGGGLHLLYRERLKPPSVGPSAATSVGGNANNESRVGEALRCHTGRLPGHPGDLAGIDLRADGGYQPSSVGPRASAATSLGEEQEEQVRRLRNSTGRLPGIVGPLPGIDLRADGGYIVAPPSLHMSGNRYSWLDARQAIADAPEWLAEAPRHKTPGAPPSPPRFSAGQGSAYGRAALDNALTSLRCAPVGQRNHTLNRVAFSMAQLVAGGELLESSTRTALSSTAALGMGLTQHEVSVTIASAFDAGSARPRTAPHRVEER